MLSRDFLLASYPKTSLPQISQKQKLLGLKPYNFMQNHTIFCQNEEANHTILIDKLKVFLPLGDIYKTIPFKNMCRIESFFK